MRKERRPNKKKINKKKNQPGFTTNNVLRKCPVSGTKSIFSVFFFFDKNIFGPKLDSQNLA